ncbi:MAG: hypothetical protein V8T86_02420 [Victivallis sp.]
MSSTIRRRRSRSGCRRENGRSFEEFAAPGTGTSSTAGNEYRLDAPAPMSGRVIRLQN